jgi:predicted esterase
MRRLTCLPLVLPLACADAGPDTAETGEESAGDEADATDDGGETGSTDEGGDGDGDSTTGGSLGCEALTEGVNTIDVDGVARSFILNLPDAADAGGPWPVVFNWHGLGDTAANMSGLIAPYVNGPEYTFIGVTPEDADYQLMVPLLGLVPMDWNVFMVTQDSPEMDFYDAMIGCIDDQFGIDPDRVHTMGFSLGGITSDLLATSRSDDIASVATYSGGYWNNPTSDLGLVATVATWPEHTATNTYAQLFLHGGTADTFPLGPASIQFGDYSLADSVWLASKGHPSYVCDHGGGHTAPPAQMGPQKLLRFFADHPRGAASPYAGSLPADWPSYCAEVP